MAFFDKLVTASQDKLKKVLQLAIKRAVSSKDWDGLRELSEEIDDPKMIADLILDLKKTKVDFSYLKTKLSDKDIFDLASADEKYKELLEFLNEPDSLYKALEINPDLPLTRARAERGCGVFQ